MFENCTSFWKYLDSIKHSVLISLFWYLGTVVLEGICGILELLQGPSNIALYVVQGAGFMLG